MRAVSAAAPAAELEAFLKRACPIPREHAMDNHSHPAPAPFAYDGPVPLQAPILTALRRVVDPEVALNIVDVGLVYAVTARPGEVHVRMTMTSAACPVADVIMEDVQWELSQVLPEGTRIDLELVW